MGPPSSGGALTVLLGWDPKDWCLPIECSPSSATSFYCQANPWGLRDSPASPVKFVYNLHFGSHYVS